MASTHRVDAHDVAARRNVLFSLACDIDPGEIEGAKVAGGAHCSSVAVGVDSSGRQRSGVGLLAVENGEAIFHRLAMGQQHATDRNPARKICGFVEVADVGGNGAGDKCDLVNGLKLGQCGLHGVKGSSVVHQQALHPRDPAASAAIVEESIDCVGQTLLALVGREVTIHSFELTEVGTEHGLVRICNRKRRAQVVADNGCTVFGRLCKGHL